MLERKAGFRTWDRFYGDIAILFEDDPDALRGCRVLLGDDNELHAPPADSQDLDQPLVFFPPVRERSDDDEAVEGDFDLAPPALLRRRLVLLNENEPRSLAITRRRQSALLARRWRTSGSCIAIPTLYSICLEVVLFRGDWPASRGRQPRVRLRDSSEDRDDFLRGQGHIRDRNHVRAWRE
jgi:hypothetical protein